MCNSLCGKVPKRYIILAACVVSNAASFAVRAVMPLTILRMAIDPDWFPADDMKWSPMYQALLLIAFYIGYAAGVFCSYFAVRSAGARLPLTLALIVAGVATVVLPLMPAPKNNIRYSIGILVLVCRLIAGLATSLILPGFQKLLRLWLGPLEHRSAAIWMTNGANLGYAIGLLLSGMCAWAYHWRIGYFAIGAFSIVVGLLFFLLVRDAYEYYPGIQAGEVNMLRTNGAAPMTPSPPFGAMICSPAVWAVLFAQIGHSTCYYLVALIIPRFINDCHSMDLDNNTWLNFLIWMAMWLCTLISYPLEQILLNREERLSHRVTRVFFNTIASIPGAVCLSLLTALKFGTTPAIVMLAITMFFKGAAYSGFRSNVHDLTDNFAGEMLTVTQVLGLFCAIVLPLIWGATVGSTTAEKDGQCYMGLYDPTFYTTVGVMLGSSILFALLSSGETQWWDTV